MGNTMYVGPTNVIHRSITKKDLYPSVSAALGTLLNRNKIKGKNRDIIIGIISRIILGKALNKYETNINMNNDAIIERIKEGMGNFATSLGEINNKNWIKKLLKEKKGLFTLKKYTNENQQSIKEKIASMIQFNNFAPAPMQPNPIYGSTEEAAEEAEREAAPRAVYESIQEGVAVKAATPPKEGAAAVGQVVREGAAAVGQVVREAASGARTPAQIEKFISNAKNNLEKAQ